MSSLSNLSSYSSSRKAMKSKKVRRTSSLAALPAVPPVQESIVIEYVIDARIREGVQEYFCHWTNNTESWEDHENVDDLTIAAYLQANPSSQSSTSDDVPFAAQFDLTAGLESFVSEPSTTLEAGLKAEFDSLQEQGKLHEISVDLLGQFIDGSLTALSKITINIATEMTVLQDMLELCCVLLDILSAPGIDRRLFREDAVDKVVLTFESFVKTRVFPLYDQTYRAPLAGQATNVDMKAIQWPKMKQASQKTLRKGALVFEKFGTLLGKEVVAQHHVQKVAWLGFELLNFEELLFLHVSIISCITAIFQKNENMRPSLLNDLVSLFRSYAPSSKRYQRTFPLSTTSTSTSGKKSQENIQMSVALLLQMIQSCAKFDWAATVSANIDPSVLLTALSTGQFKQQGEAPMEAKKKKPATKAKKKKLTKKQQAAADRKAKLAAEQAAPTNAVKGMLMFQEGLKNNYKASQQDAYMFATQLFDRLVAVQSQEKGTTTLKRVFSQLVEDLIKACFLPEWPAAELMLYVLGTHLANKVKDADANVNTVLRGMCVDLLGVIIAHVQSSMLAVNNGPIEIRRRYSIDEDSEQRMARPDDAGEDARCICGWMNKVQSVAAVDVADEEDEDDSKKDKDGDAVMNDAFDEKMMAAPSEEQLMQAGFMLDCDGCHCWFHGACVGIDDPELIERSQQMWYCDSCYLRRCLDQEQQQQSETCRLDELKASKEEMQAALDAVLKKRLLGYFEDNEDYTGARHFHLTQMLWVAQQQLQQEQRQENSTLDSSFLTFCITELRKDPTRVKAVQQRTLEADRLDHALKGLRHEAAMRLDRQLSKTRSLVRKSKQMLLVLLNKLHDSSSAFRARVMRSVGVVVAANPAMLGNEHIQKSVAHRMTDQSKSVREACMDLVGRFLLHGDGLSEQYYGAIIDRLRDSGVSVRKRVIKILRDISLQGLQRGTFHSKYDDICVHLLRRSGDEEETVRNLVQATFTDMWFSNKHHSITHERFNGLPIKGDDDVHDPFTPNFHAVTRKIVQIIAKLSSMETELFLDMLCNIVDPTLRDVEDDETTKKSKRVDPRHLAICGSFVDAAIYQLLKPATVQPSLADYIKTINLLSHLEPSFVRKHVSTLEPYLVAELRGDDIQAFELFRHLTTMFIRVLPTIKPSEISAHERVLGSIHKTMLAVTTKGSNMGQVKLAVPCLCAVSTVSGVKQNKTNFMKVLMAFLKFLHERARNINLTASPSNAMISTTVRSALCVGLMTKEFDVEAYCDEQGLVIPVPLSDDESQKNARVYAIFELLSSIYNRVKMHKAMGRYVLEAIILLFARVPELTIQAKPILHDALTNVPHLFAVALGALREFVCGDDAKVQAMQDTERKKLALIKKSSKSRNSSSMTDESDEEDEDMGVQNDQKSWVERTRETSDFVPGMIHEHEASIRAHCLSSDRVVRYEASSFVSFYLKQGVTNPMESVSYVMALLTERQDKRISGAARVCLRKLSGKSRFILEQRFIDGLRLSFLFQRQVFPNIFDPTHRQHRPDTATAPRFTVPQDGIQSLYHMLGNSHMSIMRGLIDDLINVQDKATLRLLGWEEGTSNATEQYSSKSVIATQLETARAQSKDVYAFQLDYMCYVVDIISQLRFIDDEPLQLVNRLSRMIARIGGDVLNSMNNNMTRIKKLIGAAEDDEDVQGTGSDESDETSTMPELLASLKGACRVGMVLSTLIALKQNMHRNYGLDDKRFAEWSLHAKKQKDHKVVRVYETKLDFSGFPFFDVDMKDKTVSKKRSHAAMVDSSAFVDELTLAQFEFFQTIMENDDAMLLTSMKKQSRRKVKTDTGASKQQPAAKKKQNRRKKPTLKQEWDDDSDDDMSSGEGLGVLLPQRQTSKRQASMAARSKLEEEEDWASSQSAQSSPLAPRNKKRSSLASL